MKRTCLLSTAAILATLTTSSVAMAETKPAIVWIPTADVDITPSGAVDTICEKMSAQSGVSVAAGCLPADEPTTLSPNNRAQEISDGVAEAFAAYDLRVVNEPPPPYVPVYALFTGAEASKENNSYSCTSEGPECAANSRDEFRSMFLDGTNNCTDPDYVHAAVYQVGLLAGLERKEGAPTDFMNYPPDYTMPASEFVDECGTIAQPIGGKDGMTPQPIECTSLDHTGCDMGEQNSNADLVENLGPATTDEDAPVITVTTLADGDVIEEGGNLRVDARIEEASNYAAVRITIASDSLVGVEGVAGGELSFCTTDICDRNFLDGEPFKTADSEWTSGDLPGLPGGDYVITVEASDYYGNEAETIVINVTVEGGPIDPTDGDTDDSGDPTTDSNGSDPTGQDTFVTSDGGDSSGGDTDDGGGSAGGDDDSGGCSVASEQGIGGTVALMLGLLGLGFIRREA
jgi:hypothetical protein